MTPLLGHAALIESILKESSAGRTVLLYGPWGIGKTAILRAILSRALAAGRPAALAPVASLGEVTLALSRAYPEVATSGRHRRAVRGGLRLAIERRAGVLLIDRVDAVGTALKGFLRSLAGTGLGVVLAAEVSQPRDQARLRAQRLTYLEHEVPPLGAREMSQLLEMDLRSGPPPSLLSPEDHLGLLEIARGRPGVLAMLAAEICSPRYWRDGKLLLAALRAAVLAGAAGRLLAPAET
jgi:hypothetical protein